MASLLCSGVCRAAQQDGPDARPQNTTAPNAAQAAIDRAAKHNRYLFLLLYEKEDPGLRSSIAKAMKDLTSKADFFGQSVRAPEAQALLKKHRLQGRPLPMLLAISPSGIVTRAFDEAPSPDALKSALLSPGMEALVQALREGKGVLLTFTNQRFPDHNETVAAVRDFAADYRQFIAVVLADLKQDAELASRCGITESDRKSRVMIVLDGRIRSETTSPRTKRDVARAFQTATSRPGGCCGGGGKACR